MIVPHNRAIAKYVQEICKHAWKFCQVNHLYFPYGGRDEGPLPVLKFAGSFA